MRENRVISGMLLLFSLLHLLNLSSCLVTSLRPYSLNLCVCFIKIFFVLKRNHLGAEKHTRSQHLVNGSLPLQKHLTPGHLRLKPPEVAGKVPRRKPNYTMAHPRFERLQTLNLSKQILCDLHVNP